VCYTDSHMNKQTIITIAVTVVAVIITAGVIFKQSSRPATVTKPMDQAQTTPQVPAQEKCIVTVGGNKYDVTAFISLHPGGPEKIKAWCGKDATEIFNAKHSDKAKAKLETMKVQ